MKGQKLFVRPMETADRAAVTEFLQRESPLSSFPPFALLGKLAGNLVAVLALEVTAESVAIRDLVVAHDLRRKRIGGFMIDELSALAVKLDREQLVIECDGPPAFLQRTGFFKEGEQMVRRVNR